MPAPMRNVIRSKTRNLSRQARLTVNRIVNFVRPAPQTRRVTVEEILRSSQGHGVVDAFINLFYKGGSAPELNYRGVPILKNPCDLWMSLELFQRLEPTAIVETGTHHGGSALYYANMLRLLGISCEIITIDMNPKWSVDPEEHGITSVVGYTNTPKVVDEVHELVRKRQRERPGPVMVFLDADHRREGVISEMRAYHDLVTIDSYMVVEDTLVNGHPSSPEHGPGPWEAVQEFLAENSSFEIDDSCERFLLTYNPQGWLRKVHD